MTSYVAAGAGLRRAVDRGTAYGASRRSLAEPGSASNGTDALESLGGRWLRRHLYTDRSNASLQ